MSADGWVPTDIDVTTPSTARIYDYVLGGKDNFPPDRKAAERIFDIAPEAGQAAHANRVFLQRVVRYLAAERGVTQFVDVGTGIPTYPAVHDVAHQIAPEARVVYVDNDPVALTHARALMANMGGNTDRVAVCDADMRRPETIINDPEVRKFIDWDQPVAVLMLMMLHFATDDEDPEGIVATFRNRMAPGSYVALTHISGDDVPREDVDRFEAIYTNATSTVTFRSGERIRGMLTGFTLAEPGLVFLENWRPELPPPTPTGLPERSWIYAALGEV